MAFQDFDFETLLEAAAFQPDRVESPAAWIGHIPLAAWLMRMARPKVFVELGAHSGNSYFAFCQAAKAEGLAIQCFAVDTWRGDEHSGLYDEDVYARVATYNRTQFGGFSTLLRTTFDDACRYFADASIELLHIDGLHTYEAVQHDFETWAPKLAPDAFVVFHDTNVREREFGVWKFWRELQERFPCNVEFAHCNGLGVLWLGGEQSAPEWLRPGSPVKLYLTRYFASLGARIEEGERSRTLIQAAAACRSDLENRLAIHVAEIGRLNASLSARNEEVSRLNDSLSARGEEVHQLNASLSARNEEVRRLNDSLATHGEEVRRLDHLLASQSERFRRLNERLSVQERGLSSIRAAYDSTIAQWNDERSDLEAQFAAHAHVLFAVQAQLDKVMRSRGLRTVEGLMHFPRSAGRTLRWPFARAAFHRNGKARGWLRGLGYNSRPIGPAAEAASLGPLDHPPAPAAEALPPPRLPVPLDESKPTILIVAHEASRSGAPILALNLIQLLSPKYNIISLVLGGGELTEFFRKSSSDVFVADRRNMNDEELFSVVHNLISLYKVTFAIVNSIESRRVLSPLRHDGVPTVSLVHEFSAYTRPRTAIPEVITQSTKIVFSTKLTLQDATTDFSFYPGRAIYLEAQGKCTVPADPIGASEASSERLWLTARLRPEGERRHFLVIGVGNIEIRKGIDLFIDCAAHVKRREGGERFRFVWIGNGFDPELDGLYSVYLADEIKRANLEAELMILRGTSQIEAAYRLADALAITSRLDPLPNVAIDALSLGLPVFCFEKATGIADILSDNGLGDCCVAGYFDTHDMANKIMAVADSDELKAQISRRSQIVAKETFDMGKYVERIEGIALRAVEDEDIMKNDSDIILRSSKFRSDFFAQPDLNSLADEALIDNYLLRMSRGTTIRKPMPGFHPTVYISHQAGEGWRDIDPFADYLAKGLPSGPWCQQVICSASQESSITNTKLRLALHIHVFYPEQLLGIVERLNFNFATPDVFISVATQEAAAEVRQAFVGYRGTVAKIKVVRNLGRDIGPLLTEFGRELSASYDIIGHLHTKESVHVDDRSYANAWSAFLLENMLGGDMGGAMLDCVLRVMDGDPGIGIVFPDDPFVVNWTKNRAWAESLAERMECGPLPEEFNFPIGCMFWSRAEVLAKFVDLGLEWGDYPPEPLPIDGTMLHAIERLFGVVPELMGLRCAVTNVRGVTR